MKILALDTTGLVASVALVDENKTIAEFTTNYKKTHSQTIMPMVENLKNMVDLDLSTIDYIACACGQVHLLDLELVQLQPRVLLMA